MLAGSIPYEDMNPIQAAYAVVNKNLRPAFPTDCPPPMQALIQLCWSPQPEKRPEFWQLVKVLEQFESLLAHDGSLKLVPNSTCQDHKKALLQWIQKLSQPPKSTLPRNPPLITYSSPMPKPKFM
ncbi:hypothetical protein Nepgr_021366 [Nepenthes gracilis]|uniref:Serine-threonine/tyrosine-protein kinase catalytic domain-containing protein n=1 Tax=Nepenthes gracilis TaxID=150966 RepID=A0AAD3SYH8_NEPGR|nr:hypothetical protein Nepgr_021366 [Nepenthes gracilis]